MNIKTALPLSLLIASSLTTFAGIDASKLPAPSDKKDLTFAKDIKPLFEASCARCHSGERAKAGLHLDTLEGVLKGSKEGPVVVKSDSAKSLLVEAISQLDPETAMPPKRGGGRGPGGPGGPGGPNAQKGTNAPTGGFKPGGPGGGPAKPLTAEQVGLVRAWIDQGAK